MNEPEHIISYLKKEKRLLVIVTITGVLYNIGMVAGPWFEGKLAQYLYDIICGKRHFSDMLILVLFYLATILAVQGMRFMKRLFVRKFANNINRNMKKALYKGLINTTKARMEKESIGNLMTKAVSDVDACSEGMRKFTTEVFDTGIVMISYIVMLFCYDFRLSILACIFPPFAYIIAKHLKVHVIRCNDEYKNSAGRLNEATLDRINTAITYRVYGQENNRDIAYDNYLDDYEKKAVKADLWLTSMQPIYQIISMISVVFILWFGSKNVLHTGWSNWDIAAFMTFITCFTKLAVKSSKAAKLFNAVQKAEVSWKRILPLMRENHEAYLESKDIKNKVNHKLINFETLAVRELSFNYPDNELILDHISFEVKPGEILGVTGEVASGKSTLGKAFLCEYPYEGSIKYGEKELYRLTIDEITGIIGYMGHQPELLSDSIENNILLGEHSDIQTYLHAACIEQEVNVMPEGVKTLIGKGGIRLSGGQQQRLAFARTLCHIRPVIILDDSFSAVDYITEQELYNNLRNFTKECIVILISHRLSLFPQLDKVLWLEDGSGTVGTHESLMKDNSKYNRIYKLQNDISKDNNEKRVICYEEI